MRRESNRPMGIDGSNVDRRRCLRLSVASGHVSNVVVLVPDVARRSEGNAIQLFSLGYTLRKFAMQTLPEAMKTSPPIQRPAAPPSRGHS
jgi:hypothetical protein